jgi:hypothetical protein
MIGLIDRFERERERGYIQAMTLWGSDRHGPVGGAELQRRRKSSGPCFDRPSTGACLDVGGAEYWFALGNPAHDVLPLGGISLHRQGKQYVYLQGSLLRSMMIATPLLFKQRNARIRIRGRCWRKLNRCNTLYGQEHSPTNTNNDALLRRPGVVVSRC